MTDLYIGLSLTATIIIVAALVSYIFRLQGRIIDLRYDLTIAKLDTEKTQLELQYIQLELANLFQASAAAGLDALNTSWEIIEDQNIEVERLQAELSATTEGAHIAMRMAGTITSEALAAKDISIKRLTTIWLATEDRAAQENLRAVKAEGMVSKILGVPYAEIQSLEIITPPQRSFYADEPEHTGAS